MTRLDRHFILSAAGVLACGSLLALAHKSEPSASGEQTGVSALISTARLHQAPIDTTVSGYGFIAAASGKARNLTLAQAGLVTEVRATAGQVVKRGTTLLTLSNDPAGYLAFQQAQTSVDFARSELDRTRELRTQNLATESQVAAAEKALRDALASLDAQRALGASVARSELKAPFDGIVVDIPVAPGDRPAAGQVLARTIPDDSVQIVAGLSPQDARRVSIGMPADIEVVGDDRAPVKAHVTQVQSMIDPASHLVNVILEPSGDASAALLPAEAARAVIAVATTTSWLAPRAAVLRDVAGAYLYQVVNGHAKRIDVTTPGGENESEIAVEGPFDPASKVAVLGAYELEDGMAVREAAPTTATEMHQP